MIALTEVRLETPYDAAAGYPFDVPALAGLRSLVLDAPVTTFVGENGSGKSTLLEAIALACRAITVGAVDLADDPSAAGVARLASSMRLVWTRRDHRGFFLRAEDFLGYARRMAALRSDLERDLLAVDAEYRDRPGLARELARTPFVRELAALEVRYGPGLEMRSHGEGFLDLLRSRLVPGGLYLLDEPEAALSPARQLGLIALLRQVVEDGGQVIMATHAPILLAYPGAAIWSFDASPIRRVAWGSLEHVTLTRDFLRDPEAYLRHL